MNAAGLSRFYMNLGSDGAHALASLVLGALVAGCAVDTGAAPGDDPTGTATSAYQIESYDMVLPRRGGTGGSLSNNVACGTGNVVVGIWGSVRPDGSPDDWLYRLGLVCATLYKNGSLSPTWTTASYGGTPQAVTFYSECPSGKIATGVFGQSATYVDAYGLLCDAPPSIASGIPTATSSMVGGLGGSSFSDRCPPGYAITYMDVVHGTWVDMVQPHCQYVAP